VYIWECIQFLCRYYSRLMVVTFIDYRFAWLLDMGMLCIEFFQIKFMFLSNSSNCIIVVLLTNVETLMTCMCFMMLYNLFMSRQTGVCDSDYISIKIKIRTYKKYMFWNYRCVVGVFSPLYTRRPNSSQMFSIGLKRLYSALVARPQRGYGVLDDPTALSQRPWSALCKRQAAALSLCMFKIIAAALRSRRLHSAHTALLANAQRAT